MTEVKLFLILILFFFFNVFFLFFIPELYLNMTFESEVFILDLQAVADNMHILRGGRGWHFFLCYFLLVHVSKKYACCSTIFKKRARCTVVSLGDQMHPHVEMPNIASA